MKLHLREDGDNKKNVNKNPTSSGLDDMSD
jgi:hypothetical protein